ncbi:MAG: hypothetical protein HZA20_10755 [Nitrospirae bacterium]|nr:hypothetical protein [Nitrospirota bacterium]
MCKLPRALMLAMLALFTAGSIEAAPTITLSDGANTVTVVDGGAGDTNATPGIVGFSGPIGLWVVNVTTGIGSPLFGLPGLPQTHLDSVDLSMAPPIAPAGSKYIDIMLTDTVPGPLVALNLQTTYGLVTQGSVWIQTYANGSLLLDSGLLAGSFQQSGFSGSMTTLMPSLDPITLMTAVRVTHPGTAIGSEITSFHINIAPLASQIGDTVWHDINNNGVQDAGEPGIEGVTVDLLDPAGFVMDTVTTDANGTYEFYGLTAGDYFVDVDENTLPPGLTPTTPLVGDAALDSNGPVDGGAAPITLLTDSDVDQTIDFGYISSCTGRVGDFVWHDINRNGIQDNGEPGISGVNVVLTDGIGNTAITATAADGSYAFTGLCSGNYFIDVDETTLPPGFSPTTPFAGGNTGLDSNGPINGGAASVSLPDNATADLSADFGYVSPCTGMIGDFVWHDINRNGIQDAGEPGMSGVNIVLTDGFGNSSVAITAADGSYAFTGICSGSYAIDVDESTLPPGFTATTPFTGDAALDSNGPANGGAVSIVMTTDATVDQTIDFGYLSPCTGMIGDLVWDDANRDGIQDASEPGMSGVRVILKNSQGVQTGEAITDVLGFYEFTGLCAGNYFVDVDENTIPPGMVPTAANQGGNNALDSDEPADGTPIPVALGSDATNNLDMDFGFNKPCAGMIGDLVWDDANRDGIQNAGEPGLAGITVALSNGMTVITDASGHYDFRGLCAGTYTVSVSAPAGYVPSPSGQGGNTTADSNGSTASVTITDFSADNTTDFGFNKPVALTLDLRKYVSTDGINWFDANDAAGLAVCLCPAAGSEHDGGVDDDDEHHDNDRDRNHADYNHDGKCDERDMTYCDNNKTSCDGQDRRHGSKSRKYRCDDSGSRSSCESKARERRDREYADYNHDGKSDERDVDYCAANKASCDSHDRKHESHARSYRCDDSSNKSSCETKVRERHEKEHSDYNHDGKSNERDMDYCRSHKDTCDEQDKNHSCSERSFRCEDSSDKIACADRVKAEHDRERERSDYNHDGSCDERDIDYCRQNGSDCNDHDKQHDEGRRKYRCDDSYGKTYCESMANEAHETERCDYDHDGECGESDTLHCIFNYDDCRKHDHEMEGASCGGKQPGLCGKVYFKLDAVNTSEVDLGFSLSDSQYPVTGCQVPASLAAGAAYSCVIGPFDAIAGPHVNTATATGTYDGRTVQATDIAIYHGDDCSAKPSIDLEKYVSADGINWQDGDIAPGLPVKLCGPDGKPCTSTQSDAERERSDYDHDGRCDEHDMDYCGQDRESCDIHDKEKGNSSRNYRCDDSLLKPDCESRAKTERDREHADYNRDGKCDESDISYCEAKKAVCDAQDIRFVSDKRSYRCDDSANLAYCALKVQEHHDAEKGTSDYNRDGKCDERDIDYCRLNKSSCDVKDSDNGSHTRKYRCDDSQDNTLCESRKHDEHEIGRCDYNGDGVCDDRDGKYCSSRKESCGKHDREYDDRDASGCGANSGSSSGNPETCGNVYYRFVVRNTGNVDLTGFSLSDSLYALDSCAVPAGLKSGATFTCVIGPFAAGTGSHTNSATASGTYNTTIVSDTDVAIYTGSTCDTTSGGCVRSPGYWKNHPEAWPVGSITIGGRTYSKADAINLMSKSVRGDKTYTLFRALVSAKLNVLSAANSTCITDTITAADSWMGQYPAGSGVTGDSAAWKVGEPLYLKLDDYNNGKACAAYCGQ